VKQLLKGARVPAPSDFDRGVLVGVLVGEGHFGGDGRQPQITLRMHTDHEALFEWIVEQFGGRLYGPYNHSGRRYYQWMARGEFLRDELVPMLSERLKPEHSAKAYTRFNTMLARYAAFFRRGAGVPAPLGDGETDLGTATPDETR
jgi:hypothetical protein